MKQIKFFFYVGVLLLGFVSLVASCSDEEVYDFPGDAYNRVYMQNNFQAFKLVRTPAGYSSNLDFKIPVKCIRAVANSIKATVEVDNSLVEYYNEVHDTQYKALPQGALALENSTMLIPQGGVASVDTLHITMAENREVLNSLDSKEVYLVPLRLVSVEGEGVMPSTNMYSSYLTLTITEDNVNHEATEDDITGTLVADQSKWKAVLNKGEVYEWGSPIEELFSGDSYAMCYIGSEDEIQLDIDMGKEYTFDAITCYSYYGSSLNAGMSISISSDGTSWTSIAEVTQDTRFIVFYAPLTAQFIRLDYPDSWYTVGAFNVYATK